MGRCHRLACVEAAAVVADLEHQLFVHDVRDDSHLGAAAVLQGVHEQLTGEPEDQAVVDLLGALMPMRS
jgi:hypothetical protein